MISLSCFDNYFIENRIYLCRVELKTKKEVYCEKGIQKSTGVITCPGACDFILDPRAG